MIEIPNKNYIFKISSSISSKKFKFKKILLRDNVLIENHRILNFKIELIFGTSLIYVINFCIFFIWVEQNGRRKEHST